MKILSLNIYNYHIIKYISFKVVINIVQLNLRCLLKKLKKLKINQKIIVNNFNRNKNEGDLNYD